MITKNLSSLYWKYAAFCIFIAGKLDSITGIQDSILCLSQTYLSWSIFSVKNVSHYQADQSQLLQHTILQSVMSLLVRCIPGYSKQTVYKGVMKTRGDLSCKLSPSWCLIKSEMFISFSWLHSQLFYSSVSLISYKLSYHQQSLLREFNMLPKGLCHVWCKPQKSYFLCVGKHYSFQWIQGKI